MVRHFSRQQLINWSLTLAILGISLTGVILIQLAKLKPQKSILTQGEALKQEKLEKIQLDLLKGVPALGFDNLLADWLYLRFIQYFGDAQARPKTGYTLSPDYFEAIVDRDPKFVDAHLKLAAATSIFAGTPQVTIQSLNKSLESVSPKMLSSSYPPYYLWLYKGIDELLFLGDTKAAKKSYSMAIKWAETYDDPVSKNLVARTQETVNFLEKNPHSKIAQIGAWTLVLSSTADVRTQERALREIQALGAEITITPPGKVSIHIPKGIE